MKKILRPLVAVVMAAMLVSCASPYQAQMQALHNAYVAGNISDAEYRREMTHLQMNDAAWQQNNANAATTAAVVGVAALGVAAIADDHHHHHHYHHRGHWRPRRW